MQRSLVSIVLSAGLLLPAQLWAQQQNEAKSPPAKSDSKAQKPSGQTAPQKKSNAEENPFPEDVSQKAAEAEAVKQGKESAPPEGNNAKPQSDLPPGESSSTTRFSDLKDEDLGAGKDAGNLIPEHDTQRAMKDDEVGKYYMDRGDWKGAYNRFKDAMAFEPKDAEAAFQLAETASKLKLTEEAVANYKRYLELDPDGPHVKPSLKALKTLEGSSRESSRK